MKDQTNYQTPNEKQEGGYVMIVVLILVTLALTLTMSLTQSAASSSSIARVVSINTDDFYDVERSINAATAWLQANSKNMVQAFTSANFNSNFDLGDPIVGDNVGAAFPQHTLLKMKGTNHAVQLTNSDFFGSSAFPATTNIDSGAAFDAVAAFENAGFDPGVNVRLLAIWAMATDGHYEPIFRVDAVTGGDSPEHGVHGFNFIKSALVTGQSGIGYYAETGDFQTGSPNNQCWSYQYTYNAGTNSWSRGAARSNCIITARDDIALKSLIHGDVATLKHNGVNLDGGAVSGSICEGPSCNVTYSLPNPPEWNDRCAGVPIVDVTASANPTILTSGSTLASQCYRTVTVPSNKSIKLVTTNQPYYIKTLNLQNNSNSRWLFETAGPGNKYEVYIDRISGDKINGNQLVSTNLAPNQVEIYLTSAGSLTLNGTAAMNGVITGPSDHTIKILGNFSFYGALRSNAIEATGNAVLGYDEGLGAAATVSDINYTLYKASQRYR